VRRGDPAKTFLYRIAITITTMDPIDTFIQRFMHGTTGMRGCNYCVQSSPDSLFSWFDDCGSVLKHEYTFNTFLECIKKTRDFLIPHGDFMIVRTSKHLAPYAAYYITRIEDVIRVGTSDPYKMLWIAFDCEPRETNLYFVYQDQFPGFRIDGHVEHALEQQEAYFVPVGAESGIRSYVEKMNEYLEKRNQALKEKLEEKLAKRGTRRG